MDRQMGNRKDRQKYRGSYRRNERQTDTLTVCPNERAFRRIKGQIDGKTSRLTEILRDSLTEIRTDRTIDGYTNEHTDTKRKTGWRPEERTYREMEKWNFGTQLQIEVTQIDRQVYYNIDKQAGRQADKQTVD